LEISVRGAVADEEVLKKIAATEERLDLMNAGESSMPRSVVRRAGATCTPARPSGQLPGEEKTLDKGLRILYGKRLHAGTVRAKTIYTFARAGRTRKTPEGCLRLPLGRVVHCDSGKE